MGAPQQSHAPRGFLFRRQDEQGRARPLARDAARGRARGGKADDRIGGDRRDDAARRLGQRSEEHTSELQSLMRISYAVFCLKKKKYNDNCKYSKIEDTITQHKE